VIRSLISIGLASLARSGAASPALSQQVAIKSGVVREVVIKFSYLL